MTEIEKDGEFETFKLACPKCRGTIFEVYGVNAKHFHAKIHKLLGKRGSDDMSFTMEKCVKCGWQSHKLSFDHMNETIQHMLYMSSMPRRSDQIAYAKSVGMDECSFVKAKSIKRRS